MSDAIYEDGPVPGKITDAGRDAIDRTDAGARFLFGFIATPVGDPRTAPAGLLLRQEAELALLERGRVAEMAALAPAASSPARRRTP